ncbi:MAG: carboxypeptidase regulatory-like domain-containing protein [Bryobacteraceae bacterium]
MKAKLNCIVPVLLMLAYGAPYILAQVSSAQITGLVTDASGAVISGAAITVINQATGSKRQTVSNDLGLYSVPLLPPGNYALTLKKGGFKTVDRSGITLQVNQTAQIDFALEVGTLAESVQVMANASQVDTQTSTLKEVVDQRRIRELPLNGRDANQLIFLLPGVYTTNDTSGLQQGGSARGIVQPGVAANGARGNMVSYTLDGAFHNDTYTNVSLAMPNPDALQEFSVQTNNFSAEYGP